MHGIAKSTHLAVMTDTGTSYITCSSHSKVKRTQERSVYHNVIHFNKTQGAQTQLTMTFNIDFVVQKDTYWC